MSVFIGLVGSPIGRYTDIRYEILLQCTSLRRGAYGSVDCVPIQRRTPQMMWSVRASSCSRS